MTKLNSKYKNLYEHTGNYSVVIGGRGSGKSYAVTRFLIKLSFEKGQKIMFSRLTMKSAHESIIPEVQKQIEQLNLSEHFFITKTKIINKYSGGEIIFKGLRASSGDNTARNKSLSGISTLVIEEAGEIIDEDEFDTIDESIRTDEIQNRIILILNPVTKTHWIYKRFYEDESVDEDFNGIKGDTCYIHTTYLDNLKYLSKKFLTGANRVKNKNSEKYKHTYLGAWLQKSEGVIFSNWEYGKFPTDVDSVFGADWGYSIDPSTLVETFIDKKNETIYLKEHLYQSELTTSQLAKIFKRIAGDKLIVADSAEGRLIDEIKAIGINIKQCKKGAGSVIQGIKLMQDYKLIIDDSSVNLVNELNNYAWRKKGDAPIDSYNHLIDAARYIITDRLKSSDGVYYIY